MIRTIFSLIICLCFFIDSKAQNEKKNISLGAKLGVPTGISAKKYSGSDGLELVVGRVSSFTTNYDNRYRNRFIDDFNDDYDYRGYDRGLGFVLQGRYLMHYPISDLEGLVWYYGAGAQFRMLFFDYVYIDDFGRTRNEVATDIGIGPEGIIGSEYTMEEYPITFFIEVNLYMEIIDDPFNTMFQGGIGARYNF